MPGPVLLRTEALTRSFGSLMAVNRVDFTVYTGELRSIIGPNGAGKTTLFRLISGEMKPSAGGLWFQDTEITGRPQHMVALGVAKSYQIQISFRTSRSPRMASRCRPRARLQLDAGGGVRRVRGAGPAQTIASPKRRGARRHAVARREVPPEIAIAPRPSRRPLLDEQTAGASLWRDRRDHGADPRAARGRTVVLSSTR
jgi:energy-coupling factor transporter ATP-binding protein EcfA2